MFVSPSIRVQIPSLMIRSAFIALLLVTVSSIHAADLKITCTCTLLEFFYGSAKKLNYRRKVTQGDGQTDSSESVEKEIEVKPGMQPGTVLRFKGEGDSPANRLTGDLVVTIEQSEHETIRR